MKIPPFTNYLGIKVERRGRGEAAATLPLADHHRNRRGVVHGGVITTLLDTALGAAVIAAIPKEWWCATTSLSVQFLEGARDGLLQATGRVARRGSRVAFAQGEIRDEAGRVVAVGQGTWHLWPFDPRKVVQETRPYVVMKDSGEKIPVGKILAIGRNYPAHVAEMKNRQDRPPVVFFKPPSALIHDGDVIVLPADAGTCDHEVELVVVIGKTCRSVAESDALDHVAGFGVGLDMTLRKVQKEARQAGEPWARAKGFDTSAPISTVVPREKVGDGTGLAISLDVNGERRQEGNTSAMSLSVAQLVADLSAWITLERGDLVFTGTPSGVGPVSPGDYLEARLEKCGTLSVKVIAQKPEK
ncbi:MAG: fumarylacetoacetate hydrolase family protein [Acidobacteriota bacterium]